MENVKLDLARYEIFYNKIMKIMDECREALRYLSGSAIGREAGEVLVAYYLPDGPAVSMSCGILMHTMNMTRVIRYMRENRYFDEGIGVYEGDMFISNDPYIGGMHTPDTGVVAPFFYKGELLGYIAGLSHTTETGGIEAGGTCPAATEAPHDGFHMLALKLIEKGAMRRDVWTTILRSSRDPIGMEVDIRARIASNEKMLRRMTELIEEFGVEFFKAATRQMIIDAANESRAKIKQLRPGIYRSRVFSDSIGAYGNYLDIIQLDLEVTREGELVFGLHIVPPEGKGFDNAHLPAVEATIFYTLLTHLFWGIRWNSGIAEPVKMEVPFKSRLNADPSCSVGYATVGIGSVFTNAIIESLSKAHFVSGMKEEVVGASGTMNYVVPYGVDDFGRYRGGISINICTALGYGARVGKDGIDSSTTMWCPRLFVGDIEGQETIIPYMQTEFNHRPNSAGVGKWRGGVSIEAISVIHRCSKCSVIGLGEGSWAPTHQGLFGGYPGSSSYIDYYVDTDFYEKVKSGTPVPASHDELEKFFKGKWLKRGYGNNLAEITMKSGDMVMMTNHGGGPGLGDPIERDPEAVAKDIEDKVVTLPVAELEHVYCVSINPKTGKVDYGKTEDKRKKRREERLRQGIPGDDYLKELVEKRRKRELPDVVLECIDRIAAFSSAFREQMEAEENEIKKNHTPLKEVKVKSVLFELTPYINVVKDHKDRKVAVCSVCGFAYCDAKENYKYYSLVYERDPADVQPGRLGYDKDWCIYREFYCPNCGTQIEVEATPPGLPILHDTQLAEIHQS